MARIGFNSWGRGQWARPAYAVAGPDADRPAVVAAALARKNGWVVIAVRLDGYAVGRGRSTAHYVAALGVPCSGGGWTPAAEVYFAIE